MPIFKLKFLSARAMTTACVALLLVAATRPAAAQGVGGAGQAAQNSTTSVPGASAGLKRTADRTDPIGFLLDRKKPLDINKEVEDSLKNYRKEMKHMQEVVFKDLDKAALKKESGQLPPPIVIMELSSDAGARVTDIQAAYRDRARGLLNDAQRHQVDSLEAVWKRTTEETMKADSAKKPVRLMGRGGRGGPPPPE